MSKELLTRNEINEIFEIFSSDNPHPKTELHYSNNFTLLVAVVLSAQATDVGVNKATEELFVVANTPEKMHALGEGGLKTYIKTIGLFNTKARNVIALCAKLIGLHDSQVPNDFKKLLALPGVGVKTADVVLNCAFGKPTIAVDTHVFRVSNRLAIVKTNKAEATAAVLLKKIPVKWRLHAHHWLILHGRYVCKARTPLCGICKINYLCKSCII